MANLRRYISDRCWVLEAITMLLVARLLVMCCFRLVAPWVLRDATELTSRPPFTLQRRVRFIMKLAVDKLPWQNLCLPQAIAAKLMLARRGFSSTIHLGAGFRPSGELHAHAWLEAGGSVVTGRSGIGAVVPLTHDA